MKVPSYLKRAAPGREFAARALSHVTNSGAGLGRSNVEGSAERARKMVFSWGAIVGANGMADFGVLGLGYGYIKTINT